MTAPLMPKATAVWLIENTSLTFRQIGDFCGLHPLEVQGIADGEVAIGIRGLDPLADGLLTREELDRCQADPDTRLETQQEEIPESVRRTGGKRYTPISRRQDKPDGIAYLVRYFPELTDGQIGRLLGTTKPTITAVRDRTHRNIQNIQAQDPVGLGLCRQADLDAAIEKARKAGRKPAEAAEPVQRPAAAVPGAASIPGWMADVRIGGND